MIWDGGIPIQVDIPGEDQFLKDINTSGVAVGASFDPHTFSPLTPWIYRKGRVSALPGVDSGEARGINDRRDIVGVKVTPSFDRLPVWWPALGAGSRPVELPLPDGAVGGEAWDVDEDGTVVGKYMDADYVDHAYVWLPDGNATKLPLPDGTGPMSVAYTIRNGWITGLTGGAEGYLALRWQLQRGEVRAFPNFDIRAQTANAQGWMVGVDRAGAALMGFDDGELTLPGLVEQTLAVQQPRHGAQRRRPHRRRLFHRSRRRVARGPLVLPVARRSARQ